MKSTAALTAKEIRIKLKNQFPGIKFRVTSMNYSGGNSVDIEWEDGASSEMVNKIIGKYEYGSFDGMTDSYNYDNARKDVPQAKYVMCHRNISDSIYNKAFDYIINHFNGANVVKELNETSTLLNEKWGAWTVKNLIYRLLCNKDLTNYDDKLLTN